jgi:thioredoxin reductase
VDEDRYDVIVVGGGAAGLSGGLYLGRARRRVVVVDSGEQRNAGAAGIHGFLTRDAMPPGEFLETARAEVRAHGGEVRHESVTALHRSGEGFAADLSGGGRLLGRKVLLAAGLVDDLPPIDGLAARWGKDVFQCPYCHAWEFRDRRLGVLAHPELPVQQALLLTQWSASVTLFTHESPGLTDDHLARLAARGVDVVEGAVERVVVEGDRLVGVLVAGGDVVPLDALALEPRFSVRTGLLEGLELSPEAHPLGEVLSCPAPAECVAEGVWLAGNIADLGGHVVGAAADGARAAIAINAQLLEEDVDLALRRR